MKSVAVSRRDLARRGQLAKVVSDPDRGISIRPVVNSTCTSPRTATDGGGDGEAIHGGGGVAVGAGTFPSSRYVSKGREEVFLVRKIISLTRNKTSLPRKTTFLPRKFFSLPREIFPLPRKVVSLPREMILLPGKMFSLPRETAALTRKIISLVRKIVSLVRKTVVLPGKMLRTSPKGSKTTPNVFILLRRARRQIAGAGDAFAIKGSAVARAANGQSRIFLTTWEGGNWRAE
jgi:hypothetical protein